MAEAIEGQPEVVKVPVPFKLVYKISTVHGIYEMKRPLGAIGTKHFALVAKAAPNRFDTDGTPMYAPAQEDKIYAIYEEWVQKVLKYIIVTGPMLGTTPFSFDIMPPEDQWALFIAMSNLMEKGDELFRILD